MAEVDVIGKIEASVQDGGWTAEGEVFGDADRLDFYQEIEVWGWMYAGGAWERLPRHAFRGHLLPERWAKFVQSSEAPFRAFTAQEFMKRGRVQGIYFKDDSTPANAHQINGMQYADIVEHILGKSGEYGHSNLVRDVWPEGIISLNIDTGNSTSVDEWEVKDGDFWERLNEIASTEGFLLYVDNAGVCHYIPHPMFDASLPDPVFTITSSHLLSPIRFERRNTEQVGQVILHGATPRGLQLTGKYPSQPTAGPIVRESGYLATSNALMDTIAERRYKFANRDYRIEVELSGAVGLMLDLLDRLALTYSSSDDGISWSAKKFWIDTITVEYLGDFTTRTILGLDAENA